MGGLRPSTTAGGRVLGVLPTSETTIRRPSNGIGTRRTRGPLTVSGAQLRCISEIWGAAMSEQRYDFFGEIFQRYFRPAIGAYPQMGGALVERLFTLTRRRPGSIGPDPARRDGMGQSRDPERQDHFGTLRDHPTWTDVCRRVDRVAPGAVLPGHAARVVRSVRRSDRHRRTCVRARLSWWTVGSAVTSHRLIRWTPRCAGSSTSTWRCGWICPRSSRGSRGPICAKLQLLHASLALLAISAIWLKVFASSHYFLAAAFLAAAFFAGAFSQRLSWPVLLAAVFLASAFLAGVSPSEPPPARRAFTLASSWPAGPTRPRSRRAPSAAPRW